MWKVEGVGIAPFRLEIRLDWTDINHVEYKRKKEREWQEHANKA